jgi:thiol-disulfide isomerase/thioredoxin
VQGYFMIARIDSKAPNLSVSSWFGGKPTNIDQEKGNVVLVEVFQVNCPGCFMYGIPDAIRIYQKYQNNGVKVIGLATAFEDYDKNNMDNLKLLLEKQEVIGDTRNALRQSGQLLEGKRLRYRIPFPVAVDHLKKENHESTKSRALKFIESATPDFSSYEEKYKQMLLERVQKYLESRQYYAETFEEFALQGTPSTILIDKQGLLRHVTFAQYTSHQGMVEQLLKEKEVKEVKE